MRNNLLGLLLAVPLAACSGNDQVLTGHVAPGFPQAITSVRVLSGGHVVASSRLAADGSFKLNVPAGTGMSLQLVGTGHDTVVFPRKTGSIDRTFTIRPGGADFDLGTVRFVGDSSMTAFSFHGSTSSGSCDDEGLDGNGAMCCDDHDDDGGTCPGTGSGSDTGSGSGSGSGSGTVPIARVSPDDSGSGSGSAATGADDGPDDGDAVCEHDFPQSGCPGGGDDGGDDGGGDGSGSGGQEADLPYDVKPQLGATATPILDAFAARGGVMPAAITNVTMDNPTWRLTELQNSTPFVITSDDCTHAGNRDIGRDRVFVTWQNPDGSTMIDHLDIEYCQQ